MNEKSDRLSSVQEQRKGVTRGRREQITHTMPPEMLAKIDAQAKARGMTRAGFINFSISLTLDELTGERFMR